MKLRWIRDGTGTLYASGAMNMDTSQRIVRHIDQHQLEEITREETGVTEETHGETGKEEAEEEAADKEGEVTNKEP